MKAIIRNKFAHAFLAFAMVFGMMFMFQTDASAATPAPTGVKQIDAGETSVKISWDAVFGEDMWYYWRVSDNSAFTTYTSDWNGSSKGSSCTDTINGLSAGKTYYVQVGTSATRNYSAAPADTVWSQPLEVITVPVQLPSDSIVFTGATETSASIAWTPVEGATHYTVNYWRETEKEDTCSSVVVTTPSATLSNLSNNTEYTISVYPYRTNGIFTAKQSWGRKIYDVPTLPTKVTGVDCTTFSLNKSKGSICLDFDRNEVADGYKYEIYKYNGKKPLITGTYSYHSISLQNSKLKANQIYKVRVCGYVSTTDNQMKFGKWSDYDYISRCCAAGTKLQKVAGNKIKASWKKVKGATGYTVYVSTKYNGKYKKMATTKKTSVTLKKAIKKKSYYYVRIVPNYKKGKKTYHATVNSNAQYSAYAYMYSSGRFYSYSYN